MDTTPNVISTSGYLPTGRRVFINLGFAPDASVDDIAKLVASIEVICQQAGLSVREPGIEEGEQVETVHYIARRIQYNQDGTETPVIDLYPEKLKFGWLKVYLDNQEDITAFEQACGVKLASIPVYSGTAAIERGKAPQLDNQFIRLLPTPVKVVYKDNPHYEEGGQKPKRYFVRWHSIAPQQSNGVQRPTPNADVPPTSQPSTNGSGASKPATPKNAAPKAPPAPVVKNDTKIEMLDRVTIEKFGRDKSRLKTSTGSYSYTRAPFTAVGIDTELWTEPGLYLFGKPYNVISVWHQPENPKSQAYWRVDRLEAVGEAEAELFGQAPVIEGDF